MTARSDLRSSLASLPAEDLIGREQTRVVWDIGYTICRTGLGLILIAAALLKGHALGTGPVEEYALIRSRIAGLIFAEVELCLGLALVGGLAVRPMRVIALGCFGVFAAVALAEGLSGHASCGCFGKLQVSPWISFAIDVAAVVTLFIFRPRDHRVERHRLRTGMTVLVMLAVGVPGAVWVARQSPVRLQEAGGLEVAGNFVILEPEGWVGTPFPLFDHIDVGPQLRDGRWILVFYHYDCPSCALVVPQVIEKSRDFRGARLALIAVPPLAPPGKGLVAPRSDYVLGSLSAQREWFMHTPVVMMLDGGAVRAIGESTTLAEVQRQER